MAQKTRERGQSPAASDEDMVEVNVIIHQTDLPVLILVKRGAGVREVLAAIQAYYASLGEVLPIAGSQVSFDDRTYIVDAEGNITGDFSYVIHENATLTLTRRITGGTV